MSARELAAAIDGRMRELLDEQGVVPGESVVTIDRSGRTGVLQSYRQDGTAAVLVGERVAVVQLSKILSHTYGLPRRAPGPREPGPLSPAQRRAAGAPSRRAGTPRP